MFEFSRLNTGLSLFTPEKNGVFRPLRGVENVIFFEKSEIFLSFYHTSAFIFVGIFGNLTHGRNEMEMLLWVTVGGAIGGLLGLIGDACSRTVVKDGQKKVTYDFDSWGNKRKQIQYYDSGKKVTLRHRKTVWGNTVTEKRVKKRPKTCFRCGCTVRADIDGVYHCCGKSWR